MQLDGVDVAVPLHVRWPLGEEEEGDQERIDAAVISSEFWSVRKIKIKIEATI